MHTRISAGVVQKRLLVAGFPKVLTWPYFQTWVSLEHLRTILNVMYEAYSDYDGDGVICIDLQALFMEKNLLSVA